MTEHIPWNNGQGLWQLRNDRGDSQRAAGKKCDIESSTIERLENGKVKFPQADTINAIQEAYNVVFDDIEYYGRAERHRNKERE